MRYRSFKRVCLALCAVGVSACSKSDDEDVFAGIEGEELGAAKISAAELAGCPDGKAASSSLGEPVVLCGSGHTSGALLHPPPDAIGAATATFYGTLVSDSKGDYSVLMTRKGRMFAPVDSRGARVKFLDAKSFPKAMHMPTNHTVDTVFQFSGSLTSASVETLGGTAKGFRIKSARPVYQMDGCSLDRRLLGTWVGDAAERLKTPQTTMPGPFGTIYFDAKKRVPLLIDFERLSNPNLLAENNGGYPIRDAKTHTVRGTIRNFSTKVVFEGVTYPSLTAMGATNPFAGASSGEVALSRSGNMHGLGHDAHWVFDYPTGSNSLSTNGMNTALSEYQAQEWLEEGGSKTLSTIRTKPHIPYITVGQDLSLRALHIGTHTEACPTL